MNMKRTFFCFPFYYYCWNKKKIILI